MMIVIEFHSFFVNVLFSGDTFAYEKGNLA